MQRLPFWIFLKPLTGAFFYKTYILDVWRSFECASDWLRYLLKPGFKISLNFYLWLVKLKPHFKICLSKKKNQLKKSNKSQINQIFTRRIKSYLKKDSLSASFIFCIKLLNAPFSSRLRNNSPTHFFLFLLFFFSILNKTISCKNEISLPSEYDMVSKRTSKFRFDICELNDRCF